MPNVTLSVTKETYEKMKKYSEFKWSEVARNAIESKLVDAELLQDLKDIREAQKDFKEGRTISHKELVKKLGLENEV